MISSKRATLSSTWNRRGRVDRGVCERVAVAPDRAVIGQSRVAVRAPRDCVTPGHRDSQDPDHAEGKQHRPNCSVNIAGDLVAVCAPAVKPAGKVRLSIVGPTCDRKRVNSPMPLDSRTREAREYCRRILRAFREPSALNIGWLTRVCARARVPPTCSPGRDDRGLLAGTARTACANDLRRFWSARTGTTPWPPGSPPRPRAAPPPRGGPGCSASRLPPVVGMRALPEGDRALIRQAVAIMAEGMSRYALRAAERGPDVAYVDDEPELHDYCWVVAGCVGLMLTGMLEAGVALAAARPRRANAATPRHASASALQPTNILLDWPADAALALLRAGVVLIAEAGLSPRNSSVATAEVRAVAARTRRARARRARRRRPTTRGDPAAPPALPALLPAARGLGAALAVTGAGDAWIPLRSPSGQTRARSFWTSAARRCGRSRATAPATALSAAPAGDDARRVSSGCSASASFVLSKVAAGDAAASAAASSRRALRHLQRAAEQEERAQAGRHRRAEAFRDRAREQRAVGRRADEHERCRGSSRACDSGPRSSSG